MNSVVGKVVGNVVGLKLGYFIGLLVIGGKYIGVLVGLFIYLSGILFPPDKGKGGLVKKRTP